jgi:cell division protein FtsB
MNSDLLNPLRWNKKYLLLVIGAFILIWFSFIDVYSLQTRYQLNKQKKELIEKTQSLSQQTQILKQKTESLENDPALLEKIAREQYGMRKPGERVYKITTE